MPLCASLYPYLHFCVCRCTRCAFIALCLSAPLSLCFFHSPLCTGLIALSINKYAMHTGLRTCLFLFVVRLPSTTIFSLLCCNPVTFAAPRQECRATQSTFRSTPCSKCYATIVFTSVLHSTHTLAADLGSAWAASRREHTTARGHKPGVSISHGVWSWF